MIFGSSNEVATTPGQVVNDVATQVTMHPLSSAEIKKGKSGKYVIAGLLMVFGILVLMFLNGQGIYSFGA